MIDVIVINMKRSTERRARMSARLDALGIPFRIFEAVDGESLSQAERDRIAPPSIWRRLIGRRDVVPGEIGCALSHINAIRANADLEFFCLLEDDAVPSPGILQFLDENKLRTLPKFDSLRLHCPPEVQIRKFPAWKLASVGSHSVCAMLVIGGSCSAQIYSRDGARKIMSKITIINAPIDEMLYMDPQIPGFRVLDVRPSVANDRGEKDSTISWRPNFVPPTLTDKPSKLIARWLRRARLMRHFILTWVVNGEVLRCPLWHLNTSGTKG
jgi:glycosyl transferase family 25